MRVTTFLWGLLIATLGLITVLLGGGVDLSPTMIAVGTLLILALGFTAAALAPSRGRGDAEFLDSELDHRDSEPPLPPAH